ncbi:MAG: TIGR02391 family protein [Spirochaetia bacterium]|nr:TIGR02391 family protein [Spirochaetia bacterium]
MDRYLHNTIKETCLPLFNNGHFPQCALEAMKQVELALKAKAQINSNLFGARLIKVLWGDGPNILLRAPFSDKMHEETKDLFIGAFTYYRNYAAHNSTGINETISMRVLVLASELLDLVDASEIHFQNIKGVEGLIAHKIFRDRTEILDLLRFLSDQIFPHETYDGMFEELARRGFTEWQYQSLFDLGFVEYKSKHVNHAFPGQAEDWDEFGWLELTDKGKGLV